MEHFLQKQWEEKEDKLYKAVIFKDFQEAFTFIIKVAFLAEKYNHHPKWINEYNKVELWLYTHEVGNLVTEKDRTMAIEIDKLLMPDIEE